MRALHLLAGASALCALAACASSDDVRTLRRPQLPPTYVALADTASPLHENIAVYEINGAPEFRLFDGGDIITTRPTRAEVARMLRTWLSDADMLADNIRVADYLLTVTFHELRGPDVIPFSDKHARARVQYRIEERLSRRVVFEGEYEAQLQARMPGVTPEMVRAAIASGLIGAAYAPDINASIDPEGAAAGIGATLGADSAAFASWHDTLLWDWPEAVIEAAPRIAEGFGIGGVLGAAAVGDTTVNDRVARWNGGAAGAAIGLLAAAPTGRNVEHWDDRTAPGAFDGTRRRHQAVRGMMRQNFNRFLFGLDAAELIKIRQAVPCADLNPYGRGPGIITSTQTAVGWDCPARRTRPVRRS